MGNAAGPQLVEWTLFMTLVLMRYGVDNWTCLCQGHAYNDFYTVQHVFSLSTQDEQFQRGLGGWGHVTVWTIDTCDDENCIPQQLFAANVK